MPSSEGEKQEPKPLSFFHRRGEEERPQPAPGLAPGKIVGDFRLVALIGQGGMGQVWEAEQISLQRTVAVKFVRPERVTERQLELFAREARAGGRLHHPGIVTVYGHGQSDGLAWIAMEFVGGAWTLHDFLDEVARADEVPEGYDRHVARFVAEVADAMHTAHEAGVIHRDLKPQNVLIAPDEHPKVTDFGLARITDESALSQTGDFAGTYFYMSPEQVTARRMGIDHRTDVFSLGIVLYEMLALQRPFQGDTSHQVATQIVTKDPPDPRTLRSKVPRDLAVITNHALEKDRDKRYSTMKEFAADLRRYLEDVPIHAIPPTRADRALKWLKRNPTKSTAAVITVTAFIAITSLLVANMRANRALIAKTSEAEASALEARENAEVARTSEARAIVGELQAREEKERANRAADAAARRADEVLRLSALQKLDDLVAEADQLWPPLPDGIAKYESWIARAQAVRDELPMHESKLIELRRRSLPWSEAERMDWRSSHPATKELEIARRHLEFLEKRRKHLESGERVEGPLPGESGVDWATLPSHAGGLNELAWPLVNPERTVWGREAEGLVLAQRALALASSGERAGIRDTLAWALHAAGRFDEAVAEEETALEEAAADKKGAFEGYLEKLMKAVEDETSPRGTQRFAEQIASLQADMVALEQELTTRPDWTFDDAEDKWWHGQLEKLVSRIRAFVDEETGLLSSGSSAEHGWGVKKRLWFASTIEGRSLSLPEAAARWSGAIASIANAAECPRYGGLLISPQLGLLPISQDPASGLWEFAHLQTGEPAMRAPDGQLILREETGLVFVLLPGGCFAMGAQSTDPTSANYDPHSEAREGPVHAVTLSPFFLSKYEMTQEQWEKFTRRNPSSIKPGSGKLHPIEQVSWFDCEETCRRLGLSLPTEAEWEYGARGGQATVWWTGNERESLIGAGNFADQAARRAGYSGSEFDYWPEFEDGHSDHSPVNLFWPNQFGLYNISGNVWEWCHDGHDDYELGPSENPVRVPYDSEARVYRGGGFRSSVLHSGSAHRHFAAPDLVDTDLGLRPARSLTP